MFHLERQISRTNSESNFYIFIFPFVGFSAAEASCLHQHVHFVCYMMAQKKDGWLKVPWVGLATISWSERMVQLATHWHALEKLSALFRWKFCDVSLNTAANTVYPSYNGAVWRPPLGGLRYEATKNGNRILYFFLNEKRNWGIIY